MRVKPEKKVEEEVSDEERGEQAEERPPPPSPLTRIEPWLPAERTTARKTTNTRPPPHVYGALSEDLHDEQDDNEDRRSNKRSRVEKASAGNDEEEALRSRKTSSEQKGKADDAEHSKDELKEKRRQPLADADQQNKREKLREMKEQEKTRREEADAATEARVERKSRSDDAGQDSAGSRTGKAAGAREGSAANGARKQPQTATNTATVRRPAPPQTEKPIELSRATKTERREYMQRHERARAARRDEEEEGEEEEDAAAERRAAAKKRTADGNTKPTQQKANGEATKRRRGRDDEHAKGDDKEEEEKVYVEADTEQSTRRTRGSSTFAAANSTAPRSALKEDEILETISDKLPASFATVRGGEDKGQKEDLCCVCFYGYGFGDADAEEEEQDGLMVCSSCGINVHESCYGVPASKLPDDFVCALCQEGLQGQVRCALCRQATTEARKGAFKPVQDESRARRDRGAWAHIACALWVPGCGFASDGDDVRAEVTGIDYLSDELYNKSTVCSLCTSREGVKMKCFNADCAIHFHPLCGLRHEWIEDFFYFLDGHYVTHQDYEYVDDIKIHKPYCKWHDPTDRHRLRSSGQQRRTKEQVTEERRQEEAEVRRRAEARKKQRLEQSSTERVLREQDKLLAGAGENGGGRKEASKRLVEDSMAEKSRKALQKSREKQQQQTLAVNGTVKPERSASPARPATTPSAEMSAGREKARALLTEQVGKKRAAEIEDELYRILPPHVDPSLPASQQPLVLTSAYKAKLQSVLANLRHNERLCEDVLERKVTAARLCAMDETGMADERLRAEREEAKAEDTEEHIRRNEVRTVRRMDGAIVQLREDTLEEVKEDAADGGVEEDRAHGDDGGTGDDDGENLVMNGNVFESGRRGV